MEFQYYGANCIKISTKKANVILDDNLSDLGGKSPMKAGDIALYTGPHGASTVETKIVIDQPGEYEVSNVSIHGVSARAHMDEENKKTATVFKITSEDVKVLAVGHIYPELSDQQLEEIGMIDVMLLPVGGNGYTLDVVGAQKIIKKVEPKLVIPAHYDDKALNYPVPQQPLADVIQQLGIESQETVPKLKVKSGELSDVIKLVVLEKQ